MLCDIIGFLLKNLISYQVEPESTVGIRKYYGYLVTFCAEIMQLVT